MPVALFVSEVHCGRDNLMEYAKLFAGRAGEGERQGRMITAPHHAAKRFVIGDFVKDVTIVLAPPRPPH